jgi:mycothiol synthase
MTHFARAETTDSRVASSLPDVPGLRFRPFRDASDYERLSTLIKEVNRHDDIPWLPTVTNLRTEMENRSSLDPTVDVLLAEVGELTVGMSSVDRAVRDGAPVYDMQGYVLPRFRRRGIGTALLDWTLDRIRQRAAVEDPDVPVTIQGGAEEQETGHRALLARAGFQAALHFFLMRPPRWTTFRKTRCPTVSRFGRSSTTSFVRSWKLNSRLSRTTGATGSGPRTASS